MKLLYFLSCLCWVSCNLKSQKTSTLSIEVFKDTCFFLTDSETNKKIEINRKMEIIENSLSDTLNLGFSILPPGYLGTFNYLRISDTSMEPFNPDLNVDELPKTKSICIDRYQGKHVQGKLKIKYTTEKPNDK